MDITPKKIKNVNVMDIEKRRVPSKHYVFVLEITWIDGTQNIVYRRYSQFFTLQTSLIDAFPVEGGVKNPAERILPFLPGKVLFRSHVREVALKRKAALEEYCKKLIKLPEHILDSEHVTSFFDATTEDISSLTNSLSEEDKKRKKSQKRADVISEPVLLEQYVALADFKKIGRGQIGLVAGDVVDVIEKSDNGWYFVSLDDEQGWVPCSYLEPLHGAEQDVVTEKCLTEEKYVSLKPYSATYEDEIDLDKGAIVTVLQKGSDGWWLVRYRGKEGWAPRAYLKSAAHLSLATTATSIDVDKDKSMGTGQGKLNVAPPPRRRTVKRTISADVKRASIKRSQYKNPREATYVALSDYQLKLGKEDVCIAEGKSFQVIEKAPNGWSLIKIGDDEGWVPSNLLSKQRKGALAIFAEEDEDEMYQNVKSMSIAEEESDGGSKESASQVGEEFVTIGAYNSTDESGISFSEGMKTRVLEKNQSGWWFIKIGEDEGWAPSTYLSPVAPLKLTSNNNKGTIGKLDIAVPPAKPNRKSESPKPYENVVSKSKTPPPERPASPLVVKTANRQSPKGLAAPKPAVTQRSVSPQPNRRISTGRDLQIAELQNAMRKSPTPQARNLQQMRGIVSVDEHNSNVRNTQLKSRKVSEPAMPFRPSQPSTQGQRRTSDFRSPFGRARKSPVIPERPVLVESTNLYVTVSAYDDDDEGMLSFAAGEKVDVLEKDDGGWWLAMIGVKKGWVPSNFLKKM